MLRALTYIGFSLLPHAVCAGGLATIFSKALFVQLFPQALPVYQYENLVLMAGTYPAFANTGNNDVDKREVAAFLGQVALETGYLQYAEEIAKNDYCQASAEYPCYPGKQYYGRGAIQLSWNYNYKDFGAAVGLDLVRQPELVATDKNLVWRSALWYWNTDKWNGNIHNVVGQPGGFAYTTYLINGGLECGLNPPNKNSEKARIANYVKFCSVLGVSPGDNLSCQTSAYPPKTPWPTAVPTPKPTSDPSIVPAPAPTTPSPTSTSTAPTPTPPAPTPTPPAPTATTRPPSSVCSTPTGVCTNCNYNDGAIAACFAGWTQSICASAGANYHWCGPA
ncbi:hypothetical protein SPRG_08969 [Saprolegnia parasitica CBS 223.65]|uniref:Glycoside hydrolase family 19 catalytic domain-containing protein n=1 Tax=Saprolegnia parasitica (strain CBS 223.65) TaxID=695850 RepID=A0A067C974_SAPPC|nr:hypothetical protein SPRG_08969 [Saprolegnia parasitica CBS 223.65]KDO25670.1 hypothetical protein SPRG_08969 [Saprolegnia parasitica CBS 223.65]|eukprot:XP_012203700.1 hypothetical protein SPRG_08969 [Saprolegnia parasitica CBS 223.65]